jgi:hypothetical protein
MFCMFHFRTVPSKPVVTIVFASKGWILTRYTCCVCPTSLMKSVRLVRILNWRICPFLSFIRYTWSFIRYMSVMPWLDTLIISLRFGLAALYTLKIPVLEELTRKFPETESIHTAQQRGSVGTTNSIFTQFSYTPKSKMWPSLRTTKNTSSPRL